MDESKLYQLQVVGGKLSSIIGRGVATLLITTLLNGGVLMRVNEYLLWYVVISWCWIFIKATGNWIIGIIGTFVGCFLLYNYINSIQENVANILLFLLLWGIIIIDAINIVRYIALRMSIAKEGIKVRRLSKQEIKNYKTQSKSPQQPQKIS